ncbi:MAG: type II secretion system secretin GspD [Phycisphaerales bacterium]|nr:type II secretion system secretin GspD [Phycisphaerales bacterium]
MMQRWVIFLACAGVGAGLGGQWAQGQASGEATDAAAQVDEAAQHEPAQAGADEPEAGPPMPDTVIMPDGTEGQAPALPRSRNYYQPAVPANDSPASVPGADTTQPARNGTNGEHVTRQGGGMMLNFRDASIDVVLDELSAAAGYIVVKEAKPSGRVTLTSRQPVNEEEAVTLLNTVLHNAGYSAIKQGRILKIVARDQAKRMNIPVHSGSDPRLIAPTDEMITQVIPLRYASATQLRSDLQPLVNPQADFASNESSNALIITDTSANVRRVVEIIAALDTSLADAVSVKVFALKYASATDAARLINEIFGNLMTGAGSTSSNQQGGNRGPGAFMQRMREEAQREARGSALGNKVTASADTRTNSVVISGSENILQSVGEVLKQLDANPVSDETVFVFRLRNAQALNLESVLNNLFGAGTVSRGSTSTQQQNTLNSARSSRGTSTRGGTSSRSSRGTTTLGSSGGTFAQGQTRTGTFGQQSGFASAQARLSSTAQQQAGDLAGQVTIIADPDSNSLLVRTSPTNYQKVKEILQELDKPVAQVLIKVLIAEVTHENGSDIGTEMSVLNLRANGNGQTAGTNYNIPTQGASATGLVVQVLESNFSAAIRALETEGKLDVLSRPYILASDNQLASITVGQEVPFITNSRITDQGGIINTIEYGDIGILLDVVPHINPDGLVILDVAPEISALTGSSVPLNEQVSSPIIAKRSAQSRVGVRNGQTIVIGGLMEDRKTQTVNKVPILGDIPLLGMLFQRNEVSKAKTELLIFLTPHVASDPDQLGAMGQQEQEGAKIVPNAVTPGAFQEHMDGLQRGRTAPATQPAEASPVPVPADQN